jgi:phosphatidylserine/phosphatidylglycerophosphate/cardiolipin synthase-like enzyme
MANTDPDHWFLPASGFPRIPNYTTGNEVTVLTEGEAYYSHLSDRMASMQAGEYFHLAGWRVSPDVLLKPAASPPSPSFLDQVKDLLSRGIVVRALLWYLPSAALILFYRLIPARRFNHVKDNIDFVTGVNAAAAGTKGGSAAVLDQRLVFPFPLAPTTLASHHQKTIILTSEGHHWAYVGSIDLSFDRWDISAHNSPSGRQKEYWDAYHDLQCVLRGPAVAQIWECFRQRWNDTNPPAKPPSPPGVPPVSPSPIKTKPPSPATYGTRNVQVLRTLACRDTYPFAPHGEQTARLALEKAIDSAEHYIYIEEQFLWPCSLVDKLRDAVVRNPKLRIVMVLARDLEFGRPLSSAHYEMRNECTRKIIGSSVGQVFVYHLEQLGTGLPIYVHPKLMIIDDCFVGIGSANINKRSLTTDTEVHLGIVDSDIVPGMMDAAAVSVCRFAKELRVALWMEHLGITDPSKVEDPIAAVSLWPDWSKSKPSSPSRVHHAVCHHPRNEVASALEWLSTLQAIRALFPNLPPPFDQVDLDELIQRLEELNESLLRSGIDITNLIFGPQVLLVKKILQDFVMNIETTC